MKRSWVAVALVAAALLARPDAVAAEAPKTGDFGGTLTDPATGEGFMRYVARVPKGVFAGRRRVGLIVLLHGIGGHEKQLMGAAEAALSAAEILEDYVVVGMKSKGNGWETVDHERILKTVAWALATYPVDPRRVFAWGYSHGAIRLGVLGAEAQDVFAGVILWAGTCHRLPEQASPGDTGVRYYIVHGQNDPVVKPDQIRTAVARMAETGVRHVYHEIAGGDHGAPYLKGVRKEIWPDMVRWCDASRNARIPLTDEEAAAVAKITGKLDAGRTPSRRDIAPLADLAGPEVDKVMVRLAGHNSSSVRKAAAGLCGARLFGPTVTGAVAGLVTDRNSGVKKAAFEAMWKAAGWRAPEAIRALTQVALDAKASASSRRNAIVIMRDIRLPESLVSNPDPAIARAFEALKDDKSTAIRALAR